ncbi:MAG: amino acid adenylation domain-containing protein, partial [Phycisphaerae bacterium]|nr:amino acid adenylation domain-containing protein [Gemmatimonadaceae bacterium]
MSRPSTHSAPRPALPARRAYPLAALQGAMLVNHLRAPRSGVDIVQMVCSLPEQVDVSRLRTAWEQVSLRHDVLRTRFRWEGVAEPEQEVLDDASPMVTVLDWSSLSVPESDDAMREFLARDRTLGFDLASPPLQRVTMMRRGDDNWHMVWTFHHILMDGRSFPIVLREVFAEYEAAIEGTVVEPLPRRPFSDFVEWYTEQDFSGTEAFWRERMHGIPGPTPLPAAFHPTDESSSTGRGLHARLLDAQPTAALEQLARANGLTMNNVVQGAWSLLLARHSGESDVVFGATRACRKNTVAGADDIVGMFINTVPVRVTVRDDMPLVQWLGELREGWRKLFDAEHTPLRLIQRWSEAGPQTPLFDTQIVFENLPLDVTLQMDGGKMASRGFHLYGGTNFALTALVFGGRQLSLEIENERALIDDGTAVRLLDHLACVFEAMAANPNATVGKLSMLPDAERELVVNGWNRTATPYPAHATLVSLMNEQVARTPDAVAVSDDTCALSFAELDRRANALAARLRAQGVGAGVLVGVCAERSVELVIALVAVVKSGGAYVPIDPEYPADRVAFMLEDAGVPVLLAQQHVSQLLPQHAAHVLLLDGLADATWMPAAHDNAHMLPLPSPDDSAYMIYTSGSTGRPKGARNAHRGIVNRLLWMQDTYKLTPRDVVLQKTPFSFDVSVWEFFWPLITGARLVMAKPGGHKDSGYLASTMVQHEVTVCHFVPSMLRAFLADNMAGGCTSLRDVMASGEALPADLVASFNTVLPKATLHNLYGPTECAVDVTYWECPKDLASVATVPIGRPVANTRVHVLDERLQPVAVGVPGELYLAGVQVGQGYHNRPELSAERFVVDTLSAGLANDVPRGTRMYRTGDRARWRPDGTVEYLGRLDFQVKIRGFRIELGEIETALLAHPSVHDAVVVAYSNPGASSAESKRLVAYVVSTDGTPSTAALREALAEGLPDYMVPAIFVWLPALPLSSNGKVDRRALPAPEVERQSLSRAYVAPRTAEETVLADIWKATLKVSAVGVDDNFFELGGDSLLGVQILARAAQAGLRIMLSQLLRTPTVSALARAAGAQSAAMQSEDASARASAEALRREVAGDVPLTPVQHWFFENQGANPHHWNQAFLFEVPANTSEIFLAKAVGAV